MAAVLPSRPQPTTGGLVNWAEWWPAILGLLVLYVPTYVSLAFGLWNGEDNAHGPIVLVIALYFFWKQRAALLQPSMETRPFLGAVLLGVGLLLYALGRSQGIVVFEVGSQLPVIAGAILVLRGPATLRAIWFPLAFLIFLVPIPGVIVDGLTGPLKREISGIVEHALYLFGYPISRAGVVLAIGPYQLMVADACSGIHSMFSLTAVGLLYLYLMRHENWRRNLVLALCIWPIAFLANCVRVICLVLITYYLGDEAGQGFLHGFAGILLFVSGLLILFSIDWLLRWIWPDARERRLA